MGTFNFGAGAENYNGEVLEELLTLTAQTNQTFEEKLVHIKPQIQKKFTLPSVKEKRSKNQADASQSIDGAFKNVNFRIRLNAALEHVVLFIGNVFKYSINPSTSAFVTFEISSISCSTQYLYKYQSGVIRF